jgi:predicted AlkP superfamily phosphohydrolase/phosphomutase
LGQIYINLKGREKHGFVELGSEYEQLIREIQSKIVEFRDPDTDGLVLKNAYLRDDIYKGPEIGHAGDIQLSFRTGYRTSWQTALGAVPEHILVANLKKWSGDHCASDIEETAGFFLSNRKLAETNPSILDVAPTLYDLFGVDAPASIDGKIWTLEK